MGQLRLKLCVSVVLACLAPLAERIVAQDCSLPALNAFNAVLTAGSDCPWQVVTSPKKWPASAKLDIYHGAPGWKETVIFSNVIFDKYLKPGGIDIDYDDFGGYQCTAKNIGYLLKYVIHESMHVSSKCGPNCPPAKIAEGGGACDDFLKTAEGLKWAQCNELAINIESASILCDEATAVACCIAAHEVPGAPDECCIDVLEKYGGIDDQNSPVGGDGEFGLDELRGLLEGMCEGHREFVERYNNEAGHAQAQECLDEGYNDSNAENCLNLQAPPLVEPGGTYEGFPIASCPICP